MIETPEQLFRAFVKAPLAISVSDLAKADAPLIFVNDAFTRITGYRHQDCVGQNCRFLGDERTEPSAKAAVRESIARRQSLETVLMNRAQDGRLFQNYLILEFFGIGDLPYAIGCQFDLTCQTDRGRTEHKSRVLDVVSTAQSTRLRSFQSMSGVVTTLAHTIALREDQKRARKELRRPI